MAKVSAPYNESRAYMDGIMKRMERAHDVQLVMQLPSESAGNDDSSRRGSVVADPKLGRAVRQKQESWNQFCKFCYTALPSTRNEDGPKACAVCAPLARAGGKAKRKVPIAMVTGMFGNQLVSGPQTLVM